MYQIDLLPFQQTGSCLLKKSEPDSGLEPPRNSLKRTM